MPARNFDKERRQNTIAILSLLGFMIICVVAAVFVKDSPLLVRFVSGSQVSVEGGDSTVTPSLDEALEALSSPTVSVTPEVTGTPKPGVLTKAAGLVRIVPGYAFFSCGLFSLFLLLVVGGILMVFPSG